MTNEFYKHDRELYIAIVISTVTNTNCKLTQKNMNHRLAVRRIIATRDLTLTNLYESVCYDI